MEFRSVHWPSLPRFLSFTRGPPCKSSDYVTLHRYCSFLFISNSLFTIIPSFDALWGLNYRQCPLATTRNKTATGVIYNAVHRFYQGAVYFQNVLRYHGTQVNIISHTSIQNVRPLLRRIWRRSQTFNSVICVLLLPNFSQIRKWMFKTQIEVYLCIKYKHCFDWAFFRKLALT